MKKFTLLFCVFLLGVNSFAIPDRFAALVSEVDYSYFWNELEQYLDANNLNYESMYSDGTVRIEEESAFNTTSPFLKDEVIGIDNLLQNIVQLEKNLWYTYISDHFDRLAESKKSISERTDNFLDYNSIKNLLKIRIYPEGYIASTGDIIYEELAAGCYGVLVLDFDNYIINVTSEVFESWNINLDIVTELALNQTLDSIEIEERQYQTNSGILVKALYSDSLFLTSYVYSFYRSDENLGNLGALIAIPNREILLIYEIENYNLLRIAGNELSQLAKILYGNGTGSITPLLYWFYDGELIVAEKMLDNNSSGTIRTDIQ